MKAVFAILALATSAVLAREADITEPPQVQAALAEKPFVLKLPKEMDDPKSIELNHHARLSPLTTKHVRLGYALERARAVGLKQPSLAQAVMLQESDGGEDSRYKRVKHTQSQYFGLMQITVGAAVAVMKRWPQVAKDFGVKSFAQAAVRAKLIASEHFNIEIGVRYLRLLEQDFGFGGRKLLNAFNQGPGGVQSVNSSTFHYAISAERRYRRWSSSY